MGQRNPSPSYYRSNGIDQNSTVREQKRRLEGALPLSRTMRQGGGFDPIQEDKPGRIARRLVRPDYPVSEGSLAADPNKKIAPTTML
jgi:hypothetical protein